MRLIREFERECERQYTRGNIKGFLHVYTGEEAARILKNHGAKRVDIFALARTEINN